MDANEATTIVLSKIKNIDPENATKIMGYLLIQDLDDKDLIRLAFGPETVLQSYILKAKANLGLSSGACPPPSTPPSPSPLLGSIARPGNPNNPGGHFLPLSSPRLAQRADFDMGKSPKNPFSRFPGNPMSPGSSPSLPFGGSQFFQGSTAGNTGDFLEDHPLGEYFPFLNDPGNSAAETHLHRRSFSESDACFMSEDGGFCSVHRPCLYFARGFCKNGNSCKFLHGGGVAEDYEGSVSAIVGSPSGLDAEHMLRLKIAHQRRVASAAAAPFMPATSPTSYNKYMNLFLQHHNDPQSQRLAAMMMGDDIYKYGRFQPERNEFLAMGMAEKSNSASRQIYLTFPADSTFKDEDVSDYFSTYGPVQDVRIPYQQKRMFGFVTFHYPETVRTILAKGNPHFICNSRVLVKPYKEKGKVPEKRQLQQQQFERGEFSPSSNSSFLESGESYDHLGTRLFNSSHEMMLRRKFEQENDFQQAIELQGRRLMNLQLPEGKNDSIYHRMRSMPMGSTAPIPIAYSQNHHRVIHESEGPNQELVHGVSSYQVREDSALSNSPFVVESCGSPATTISSTTVDVNAACNHTHGGGDESKDESSNPEGDDKKESLENILPDSPFASPTKSAGDHCSEFAKLADISESAKVSGVYDNNGSATMTSVDCPPH